MKVKVIEVKDKNENKITAGHGAVGMVGEVILRDDNRLMIITNGSLLTSSVHKITVETRNSVYELEVVQ